MPWLALASRTLILNSISLVFAALNSQASWHSNHHAPPYSAAMSQTNTSAFRLTLDVLGGQVMQRQSFWKLYARFASLHRTACTRISVQWSELG
jgi:hypothetical protein